MQPEYFGGGLLGEVQQENFNELLKSLRSLNEHPIPIGSTGIPVVDKLIDGSLEPVKPGINLRVQQSPQSEYGNSRPTASKRNTVVEIIGATPSSGKTELLYRVAAEYLYPSEGRDACRRGVDGVVVWVDAGGRFSISRFQSVLQRTLTLSMEQREEIVDLGPMLEAACLQHIHVFRPQSAGSLLATLESLPSHLLNQIPSCSSSCPLRAVIISDVSSFYWQDRQEEQLEAGGASGGVVQDSKRLAHGWRKLVRALRRIQEDFGCSIIASNNVISSLIPADDIVSTSYLPTAWHNFAATKVILTGALPAKYGSGISLEEALAEKRRDQG